MSCRLERDAPTPALLEKAQKELRETPEVSKEAVVKLREILEQDGTLTYPDNEDYLITHLRAAHFYPDSAFKLIKKCADFKEKNKEVVGHLDIEALSDKFKKCPNFNILVDRDQDGRRILILSLGAIWDPNKDSPEFIFQMIYIAVLSAMLEPATQINGAVVILDFKDMGMKQVTALGPSVSYRLLTYIQEALPLRLKEVHIVNEPMVFKIVWQVFKPLIGQKLKKRIYFHKTKMESLHQQINPENLPSDYGGKKPAINYGAGDWLPAVLQIKDHIAAMNKLGPKK